MSRLSGLHAQNRAELRFGLLESSCARSRLAWLLMWLKRILLRRAVQREDEMSCSVHTLA